MKILLCALLFSFYLISFSQVTVSKIPMKKSVLLEEFAGNKCPWCTIAASNLDDLVDIYGDRILPISYHATFYAQPSPNAANQKDMRTDFGNALFAWSNHPTNWAIPSANLNRSLNVPVYNSGYPAVDYRKWRPAIDTLLEQISPVNIASDSYYYADSNEIKVSVSIYFTDTSVKSTFLQIAVVQDNIWTYQQGGSSYPDRYDATNDLFRNMYVFRENLLLDDTSQLTGMKIENPLMDKTIDLSFTYKVKQIKDVAPVIEDMRVIAYLTSDSLFGEVYSGSRSKALERPLAVNNYEKAIETSVFPNPSNGQFIFKTTEPEVERLEIFSSSGVVVYSDDIDSNSEISVLFPTEFKSGIYFLRYGNRDYLKTKKIIVQR